jgi:hypothetical protein
MKLKDLKSVLYSSRGAIQFAIVYDQEKNRDLENGCSIDYAVEKYSDRTVHHIEAFEHRLVITI